MESDDHDIFSNDPLLYRAFYVSLVYGMESNAWDGDFAVGWMAFVGFKFVSLFLSFPPFTPSEIETDAVMETDCKQRRPTNPPLGPRPPLFSFCLCWDAWSAVAPIRSCAAPRLEDALLPGGRAVCGSEGGWVPVG